MKSAPGEGSGPPRAGLLQRLGDTLLRFAGEDRSLNQDKLYELWAQTDSRCWMDTEQQKRQMPLRGLPEGAQPLVADAPVVQPQVERGTNDSDFGPSTGLVGQGMSAFQTEIDHWRRQRLLAQAPEPVPQRPSRHRRAR